MFSLSEKARGGIHNKGAPVENQEDEVKMNTMSAEIDKWNKSLDHKTKELDIAATKIRDLTTENDVRCNELLTETQRLKDEFITEIQTLKDENDTLRQQPTTYNSVPIEQNGEEMEIDTNIRDQIDFLECLKITDPGT